MHFLKNKTVLGTICLVFFVLSLVNFGVFSKPFPANASLDLVGDAVSQIAAYAAGAGMPVTDTGEKSGKVAEITQKMTKQQFGFIVKKVLTSVLSFVVNRIAYDAATYLAAGATGQQPAFQYKNPEDWWKSLGLDTVGTLLDELNVVLEEGGVFFDLCAPRDPAIILGIQLGIRSVYKRPEPECNVEEDFVKNWESTVSSIYDRYIAQGKNPQGFLLQQFKQMYNPGQNHLSAAIGINLKVHGEAMEKRKTIYDDTMANDGYTDLVDVITGNVETPADLIQRKTQVALIEAKEQEKEMNWNSIVQDYEVIAQMGLSSTSIFMNTLISELLMGIYKGVFDIDIVEADPFSGTLATIGGREAAEEKYKDLLSVEVVSLDAFSPASELVTCSGDTSRSLFSCAMDSNLATAISRAETGNPMTVAEALEDGLLRGDWALIPERDEARNQDPYCYSYGYCYGNLVKIRHFRIIPVGWEMAANSPNNSESSPISLQEVVDAFDDCNEEGEIDASHPWCHLIDPNWVLKAPVTSCPSAAPGEILTSSLTSTRLSYCMDSPSCISEDEQGNCVGGEGYCTREKNIWRFRGDDCPDQYAGCLSFKNTDTNESGNWLINTVNFDSCNADNAGCRWYRTNKYFDDQGTEDDLEDDQFEWLAGDDAYLVSGEGPFSGNRDDDILTSESVVSRYRYDTNDDGINDFSYAMYAYQDRRYFNNDVQECSEENVGCTELVEKSDLIFLNLLANPSFEDDEDNNGLPDLWWGISSDDYVEDSNGSIYGLDYVRLSDTTTDFYQEVVLPANRFYTLSFFVSETEEGDTGEGTVSISLSAVDPVDPAVDLTNSTFLGDCTLVADDRLRIYVEEPGEDAERYSCTLTTPSFETYGRVRVHRSSGEITFDAFQLEEGSVLNDFQEGYGSIPLTDSYLKLPPDYLGCTGAESDPSACEDYAPMCSAQDVGCALYTPDDGDPAVSAIISDLDQCPSECVGYDTYKQEETLYDDEDFPLYFIPSTADSCTESDVGCDEFTNLDTIAAGGESLEYYTYLRACSEEDNLSGQGHQEYATFYTWEGSDLSGYQLVSWSLLESSLANNFDHTFPESGFEEVNIGRAPCIKYEVVEAGDGFALSCIDSSYVDGIEKGIHAIDNNTECDEHDDIFNNPDCREFYDNEGNIHYREFSMTATITDDCHLYRKSESSPDDDDGDGYPDDCYGSGGYWTEAGECRYLGYPEESTTCSSGSNGCRSYTGGAGRNASTIFSDDAEDASLEEWSGETSDASISNESIAVDGHSIHVSDGTLDTLHLDEDDPGPECDEGTMCTLEDAGGSSCDITGTEDLDYCGSLVNGLVQGKTYIVSFWAKGVGGLHAELVDQAGTGTEHEFEEYVTLSGSWQLYQMGPLDTTNFDSFDDTAIMRFYSEDDPALTNEEFYLDNIVLKEVEDNLTLIKESWVTPSTCDQTPEEVDADQYYLGCEAYTDQEGDDYYLYQFGHLCSESVIGCGAYYDTQNSAELYTQIYNATCSAIDALGDSIFVSDDDDVVEDGEGVCSTDVTIDCQDDARCEAETGNPNSICVVQTATGCIMTDDMGNETTVCTITVGNNTCQFDWEGNLPSDLPTNVSMGPEAVVVSNDVDIFLIDDGSDSYSCFSSDKGCTEFGNPTFNQDHTEVTGFESAYYLDLPDEYEEQLCKHESLFCAEWSTNEDGNFYFKDPEEQLCEYKSSVTLNNQDYFGWFRNGTNNPCYFEDEDGDGVFDPTNQTELASAYLIAGEEFAVWRNGDDDYAGWAGQCEVAYDRCTEFVDVLDTEEGESPQGTSYYYLNNDKIFEEELADSQKCNGEISQREGCVLLNNKSSSELDWNAGASYVISNRADLVFGDKPYSSQTPVDCSYDEGGVLTLITGTEVDLCTSRCKYDPANMIVFPFGYTSTYGNACLVDDDCPSYETDGGTVMSGECQVYAPGQEGAGGRLANDVNTIQKVYRDRECAEWLTCYSSGYSWDDRTARWKNVCSQVTSCNEYTSQGDSSFCTSFPQNEARVLTDELYSGRDVSWYGIEYSGYAIPDNIGTEFLTEYNINPSSWCVENQHGDFVAVEQEVEGQSWPIACTVDEDCDSGICGEGSSVDYRLAHNTGSCAQENFGELCSIGVCPNGRGCEDNDDCGGDQCFKGYCTQSLYNVDCLVDEDCSGHAGYSCRSGLCVKETGNECALDSECNPGVAGVNYDCEFIDTVIEGRCINNQCLIDKSGQPFNRDEAEVMECRGYPEQSSPFPHEIVDTWRDPDGDVDDLAEFQDNDGDLLAGYEDLVSYGARYGYDEANVCAPGDPDCLCNYNKASYGNGAVTRYYEYDTNEGDTLSGVCFGGTDEGGLCTDDNDCGNNGTCMTRDAYDAYIGWQGICLERDSQINRWGNPDGDGVCLTWMPVDQLRGATDIYAKEDEAGFPLEDMWYCAEAAYYRDYYVTGAKMNQNGDIEDVYVACAEALSSIADDDGGAPDGTCQGEYDACWEMVLCPKNYAAVVGWCDDGSGDAYAEACNTDANFYGNNENDCPYFCVPIDSYSLLDGESCNDILDRLDTPEERFPGENFGEESLFGTPVYLGNTLGNDLDYNKDPNQGSLGKGLKYCVVKGIPMDDDDSPYELHWELNWPQQYQGYNEYTELFSLTGRHEPGDVVAGAKDRYIPPFEAHGDHPVYEFYPWYNWDDPNINSGPENLLFGHRKNEQNKGFWRLDYTGMGPGAVGEYETGTQGAFVEYLGCQTLVKTAGSDYDVGNKAWTQRLLYSSPTYGILDPNPDSWSDNGVTLGYSYNTPPAPAGRSLLEEYYELDGDVYVFDNAIFDLEEGLTDSGPIPLETCDRSGGEGRFGLTVSPYPDGCDDGTTFPYPSTKQFPEHDGYAPPALGVSYEDLDQDDEQAAVDGDFTPDEFNEFGPSNGLASVYDSLGQIFAKTFEALWWQWDEEYNNEDDAGAYVSVEDQIMDISGDEPPIKEYVGFDFENPQGNEAYDGFPEPPTVMSLGTCFDTDCREGEESKFTVNGTDDNNIYSGGGTMHAVLQFFATTDPNQFPLRKVIVEWGNLEGNLDQDGSPLDDNYYKARRGLQENNRSSMCDGSEWGKTSDSCQSGYFTFMHDYICSQTMVDSELDECEVFEYDFDGDGIYDDIMITNSPCKGTNEIQDSLGKCVFQPRVHVKDNWGYCTGTCEEDPAGDYCYDDALGYDECNLSCPSDAPPCYKGRDYKDEGVYTHANPWIYFDGVIVVEP